MKRKITVMLLLTCMLVISIYVNVFAAEINVSDSNVEDTLVEEASITDVPVPYTTTYLINTGGIINSSDTDEHFATVDKVYRNCCTLIVKMSYSSSATSTTDTVKLTLGNKTYTIKADGTSRVIDRNMSLQDGTLTWSISGQKPGLIYVVNLYANY